MALAETWLDARAGRVRPLQSQFALRERAVSTLHPSTLAGLAATSWPARCQVVREAFSRSNLTLYIDCAHTPDSCLGTAEWFTSVAGPKTDGIERRLLFNCGNNRDPVLLLRVRALAVGAAPAGILTVPWACAFVQPLAVRADCDRMTSCPYDEMGAPNMVTTPSLSDLCRKHVRALPPSTPRGALVFYPALAQGLTVPPPPHGASWQDTICGVWRLQSRAPCSVQPSVDDAFRQLLADVDAAPARRFHVLVTGSVYLAGNALKRVMAGKV